MYRLLVVLALGMVGFACSSPAPAPLNSKDPSDPQGDDSSKSSTPAAASPEPAAPTPASSATPAVTPPPAAATPLPATPTSTCDAPKDLGPLNADDGDAKLTASGTCAQWLQVRAVESDNGFFGSGMSLKVTLVPPPGTDFGLVAFMNRDQDVKSCGPLAIADSETPGAQKQFDITWGEGFAANDADDSRTVLIQVKSPSNACAPATTPWQLTIEGNK